VHVSSALEFEGHEYRAPGQLAFGVTYDGHSWKGASQLQLHQDAAQDNIRKRAMLLFFAPPPPDAIHGISRAANRRRAPPIIA
jgi:hypothetical protein